MSKLIEVIEKPNFCPKCFRESVEKVFYGTYEEFSAINSENLLFGGSRKYNFMPDFMCIHCQQEFKMSNTAPLEVVVSENYKEFSEKNS